MTPEQLQWGDEQWAKYLSCSVEKYKKARAFVNNLFVVEAFQDNKTGKYGVMLSKRHDTPSGNVRYTLQLSTSAKFDSMNKAVAFANETMIPSLELTDFWTNTYDVPAKILQTLHINQR